MNDRRGNEERVRQAIPFHPVLFAVAPILFVYVHNVVKIPIDSGELLLPIVFSLAMTVVLWAGLWLLLRCAARAALFVSLYLVLFFLHGHVAGALESEDHLCVDLLLFWGLLVIAVTWLVMRRLRGNAGGPLRGLTVLMNSVASGILAVNLAAGVHAFFRQHPTHRTAAAQCVSAAVLNYPDIYYILTDAYVRSDVLNSRFHVDNSAFLHELRRLGFFVADGACSNYAQTYLSLASSLNFTYLDSLIVAVGSESEDRGPLIDMIQNNRLVDFLRRRGYTIVSFASGYTGTDLSRADVHLAPSWSQDEFQGILVSTTLLREVLILTGRSSVDRHRERVLHALRELPNAGQGRHPVFVWAHILCPHAPFVFDGRGERPRIRSVGELGRNLAKRVTRTLVRKWFDENYGPQVVYLNQRLEDLVRRILAHSDAPPIIVIQGDHGPGYTFETHVPTGDTLLQRHTIFYAVYLPASAGVSRPFVQLYDSISPVNTFRVVLSQFFDTTLSLLPDRCYFSTWYRPYRLYDVDRPEFCPASGISPEPNE
ncbi:hypothetical protein JXD38_03920 [candidate division WOR-3 bacterium]|nr:hypothetical protein [candidate division WOR-3 bacterium]